jgi:hypothetical protein
MSRCGKVKSKLFCLGRWKWTAQWEIMGNGPGEIARLSEAVAALCLSSET